MKRVLVDGVWHRERRGVLVAIPDRWVGQVPNPQTIRKRPSKGLRKHRKAAKTGHERIDRGPQVNEWET